MLLRARIPHNWAAAAPATDWHADHRQQQASGQGHGAAREPRTATARNGRPPEHSNGRETNADQSSRRTTRNPTTASPAHPLRNRIRKSRRTASQIAAPQSSRRWRRRRFRVAEWLRRPRRWPVSGAPQSSRRGLQVRHWERSMSGAPQSGQRPPSSAGRRGRPSAELVRLLLVALVVGLSVAFIILNTQQVSVDWIVTTTKTPLIVVILLSLVVGGVFVGAALGVRRRSARRKRRAASAQRSHPVDQ
jgi:uncharacterized integral membrane protein